MSVLTPNMNLIQSTIGIDSGLSWEQNLNASLGLIDAHNHTSGNGVPIPTAGLNINAALAFNNNLALGLQAALFNNQASLSTPNALYTINGELYFNDATGPVQLTAAGTVNATSSGISAGAANAQFVSGVLNVNAAANTPANIQAASILIGQTGVTGGNYLTLSPPSSVSSGGFSLVLPAIPSGAVGRSFLTLDTSGNIAAYAPIAAGITGSNIALNTVAAANIVNSTITATQIANNTLTATQIANNTITATQIANNTLTATQMASNLALAGSTTSINGNYPVTVAAGAGSGLATVVWGRIAANGTTTGGSGNFTSSISGVTFTITFSNAFSAIPAVMVNINSTTSTAIYSQTAPNTGSFTLQMFSGGSTAVAAFEFIAIGFL